MTGAAISAVRPTTLRQRRLVHLLDVTQTVSDNEGHVEGWIQALDRPQLQQLHVATADIGPATGKGITEMCAGSLSLDSAKQSQTPHSMTGTNE